MRALLVVNPKATTTNERARDVLVRALRSEVDLTVEYTLKRGHAAALARAAAESGVDLVVTLGGDGTVNEAVNGLLTAQPGLAAQGTAPAFRLPALAVVPGGSTNVFDGTVHFPNADVKMAGGNSTNGGGSCFTLIASHIKLTGGAVAGSACPEMGDGNSGSGNSSNIRLIR